MAIEYLGLSEINGPLVVLEGPYYSDRQHIQHAGCCP